MPFSHACEGKSTTRESYSDYIVDRVEEDMNSLHGECHFKTDQELFFFVLSLFFIAFLFYIAPKLVTKKNSLLQNSKEQRNTEGK